MAITADSLYHAFGFGHQALGFNSRDAAIADIQKADGGALPAALAKVEGPAHAALQGRFVTLMAMLEARYLDDAEAQARVLALIRALLDSAEMNYGKSILNGSVKSPSPDYIARMNEYRIQANQDLQKAIELIATELGGIPVEPVLSARNQGGSVRNVYTW